MTEKTPDYRIKQITDYFFEKYEPLYKRKPAWSGKEAKLLQSILKSFDSRQLTLEQLKGCIDHFLKDEKFPKQNAHAFSIFAVNPDKYLAAVDAAQKHGEAMIQKVKEVFKPQEEVIKDFTLEGLAAEISKTFQRTEEDCIKFMRGQRYMMQVLNPKEGSKVHTNWIRSGKAARLYFGDDLVNRCWKVTAVKDERAADERAANVKKQAQEILQQKNLTDNN